MLATALDPTFSVTALRDDEARRLSHALARALPHVTAAARKIELAVARHGDRRHVTYWREEGDWVRGVILDDSYDLERHSWGRAGFFVGTRLYALTDGRLVQVRRFGAFAPGETSRWSVCAPGTSLPLPSGLNPSVDAYIVTPREAVSLYDFPQVLLGLAHD